MDCSAVSDSISIGGTSDDFIFECLQVLNSTTVGTAIYILSSLCPEDFAAVLDLARFDLGQPHRHPQLSERRIHDKSSTYTYTIADLKAFAKIISPGAYRIIWLEVAQHWLLTCPMDQEYYKPDETGRDLFCQKLRNDLLDSILNLS